MFSQARGEHETQVQALTAQAEHARAQIHQLEKAVASEKKRSRKLARVCAGLQAEQSVLLRQVRCE